MDLTFLGHHVPMDGYGYAIMQIADALREAAPDVRIIDLCVKPGEFPDVGDVWHVEGGTAVALCVPDWLPGISGADCLVSYTMFEASRLPAGWPELINRHAAMCLVPSRWCKDTFIDNGVGAPVEVVRWGINPKHYHPLDRGDHDGPYTFLWSGTPDHRKGWDAAYRAFCAAFGRSREVRLLLHFRDPMKGNLTFSDPNVTLVTGRLERQTWRALLRGSDCFVFPSRGEGWGSPPREAAATGLPVIATNAGGLAEELTFWGMPLDVRGVSPARYGFWGDDIGEWFEPDRDHLIHLMRWCFDNREEAARTGAMAAEFLRTHATWERTARALLAVVAEHHVEVIT